ncbi:uncharacterized protein STEHIDRAFT_119349, partial [Stereum hirsutum FP-91666 SS1]|uniref:uncharacterized protein n=1 Tax=Stereum hirsutum (strain FP-91666) TaxID=721885 RepID=UPI000440E585
NKNAMRTREMQMQSAGEGLWIDASVRDPSILSVVLLHIKTYSWCEWTTIGVDEDGARTVCCWRYRGKTGGRDQ